MFRAIELNLFLLALKITIDKHINNKKQKLSFKIFKMENIIFVLSTFVIF